MEALWRSGGCGGEKFLVLETVVMVGNVWLWWRGVVVVEMVVIGCLMILVLGKEWLWWWGVSGGCGGGDGAYWLFDGIGIGERVVVVVGSFWWL